MNYENQHLYCYTFWCECWHQKWNAIREVKNGLFYLQICKHIVVKDSKTTVLDLRWQMKRGNTSLSANHWKYLFISFFTWRLFCIYLFYKKVLWNRIPQLHSLLWAGLVKLLRCSNGVLCFFFFFRSSCAFCLWPGVFKNIVVRLYCVIWSDCCFGSLSTRWRHLSRHTMRLLQCELFSGIFKRMLCVHSCVICLWYPLVSLAVLTVTQYTRIKWYFFLKLAEFSSTKR